MRTGRGFSENQTLESVATELGIPFGDNPVQAIVRYCQEITAKNIADYGGCNTSDELLQICAQKVGTRFEVISSIEDLDRATRSWVNRGESQFASVEREFERGVLGITFRVRRPAKWETPFVSVIDARGNRCTRAWFTKWHELGPPHPRQATRRSHYGAVWRSPQTRTGRVASYRPFCLNGNRTIPGR